MIGTQINLYDQSAIPEMPSVPVVDNGMVILAPILSRKGPEEFGEWSGDEYFKMFGEPNFARYGQLSIQNADAIYAGAKIVGQRIVPADAKLANAILVAKVEVVNSEPGEGEEAEVESVKITHIVKSITTATSIDGVKEAAIATVEDGEYPLFAFTDNGRGASLKRFYISAEREISKNLSFMFYTLHVLESGAELESEKFAVVPDIVYDGESLDLTQTSRTHLDQVKAVSFPAQITAFVSAVSEATGLTTDYLYQNDVLFGLTRKGNELSNLITFDYEDGIDIADMVGIPLANGADGTNGSYPINSAATLNAAIKKFFDGTLTSEIYNTDSYAVDAVFDANFSVDVKEAIATLADFREDFVYFRDFGTTCYNLSDIKAFRNQLSKSRYIADFCQAYDVIDQYSRKQIHVTIAYSLCKMIAAHYEVNASAPFAGISYNAILSEAIKGTVNYLPKKTMSVDEKVDLEDIKVNFASYYRDKFIMESVWTSQELYSQMSFYNNVLAIQRVLKRIRLAFPSARYGRISNDKDRENYTKVVNDAISPFISDFKSLEFKYIQDKTAIANKIYTAAIYFVCEDFGTGEILNAYVLGSN